MPSLLRALYLPLFALVVFGSLAGCSTVELGHDYALSTFQARVERGVTTQTQVRNWLGAPTGSGIAVEPDGTRYTQWTYYFGHGRLPNLNQARFKLLQIRFDEHGVVRAYSWSGEH